MAHGSVETSFGKRARIRTGLRCVVVDVCIKNLSSWNTEAASGSSNRVGKKNVLGCVILPAGAVARSRNLGKSFLAFSVCAKLDFSRINSK